MSENNSASARSQNFSTPKRTRPEYPKVRGQRDQSHGREERTSDQLRCYNRYRDESGENCKTPDQKKRIASPLYKETPKRFRIDSPDRGVIRNSTPRRSYEDSEDDARRSGFPFREADLFLLVYSRIYEGQGMI